MGLVAEAKRIKEVHPDYILMFRSGNFYKVFGKDAYILSDLFDYNIKIIDENVATCGFPLNGIFKVRVKIEEKNINYMVIDSRNNYDVEVKEDFKNLNTYNSQFEKSYTIAKCKKRIKHISDKLTTLIKEPNFKEIIKKIEEVLNETGEV